ncbi:DUF1345 domain-containing protein [Novosphingobium capsulatum]|uniref:DUF1345 domain-containing protein n=1 Tax=Novosphingobium capsulatum TaxID=13688 RepID=UPI0007874F1E|nr:DUF1345 domain-containing protein [Novosphingobium capsulatum]WQD93358.1 DUF1345 domain-containing protein [Novosphingobium capsulatum]
MSGAGPSLHLGRLAPPRFILFLVLLMGGTGAWWVWHPLTRNSGELADSLAMGFDFAALAFLLSLVPLLRCADADTMRQSAVDNDANRVLVLCITTVLTAVVMASIAGELPRAAHGDSLAKLRLIGTLVLTWLFANTVYGLHYAHLYYTRDDSNGRDRGGLDFPGTDTPDYFDFAYFSFTLGMTFQTSDTGITSGRIRRIVTLHSFAAFVFNIGVIAFTINALGAG